MAYIMATFRDCFVSAWFLSVKNNPLIVRSRMSPPNFTHDFSNLSHETHQNLMAHLMAAFRTFMAA
jgi:hypothetical protein